MTWTFAFIGWWHGSSFKFRDVIDYLIESSRFPSAKHQHWTRLSAVGMSAYSAKTLTAGHQVRTRSPSILMSFSCHTDSFVSSSVWNRLLHVFPYYDLWDFLSCLAVPSRPMTRKCICVSAQFVSCCRAYLLHHYIQNRWFDTLI